MKKIFYLLGSLLLVLMVFSACKKSPVQIANDDYDYNSIKPVIFDIDGPSGTAASGLAAVTYMVTPRGGSTYKWEVVGHGATITPGNPSYTAEILFNQSDVDVTAQVKVTETTQGGITSEPISMDVALAKFKPMDFNEFVGQWVGTETDGGGVDHPVDVTVTGDETSGTITFPCIAGTPTMMGPLFEGWGELFQPGIGNEGNVIVNIDLLTGGVTISCQYMGQTLPGPWDYWFAGAGTWEGFNKSMTFSYGLQWDDACGDDYNYSTMVITKQ
ncbi:MAG: hypothetical protein K8S00_01075 [Bacteroidales bacterium]|nr:hypothetical protein [Bacteroidales bacterium]